MLAFACSFLVGNYYCYDYPACLEIYFEREPYNLTQKQVNLMYSVYSFPNMILPLFGGILLDKIGIRAGLFIFTTIMTLG